MKKIILLAGFAVLVAGLCGCETTGAEVKNAPEKSGLEAANSDNEAQLAVDEQEKEAVKVLDAAGEETKEVEALPAAESNDSPDDEIDTAGESEDREMQAEVDAAGGTGTSAALYDEQPAAESENSGNEKTQAAE